MASGRLSVPIRAVRCIKAIPVLVAITACAGSAPTSRLQAYGAVPAYSHSVIEGMSDQEYIAYARDALVMVATGNPRGEQIIQFFDERSHFVDAREFRRIREDAPGEKFWLVPYRPEPGEFPYFFQLDPRALRLPRLPMNKMMLGLIMAHEIQHAYDAFLWPQLTDAGTPNYVMMELNACQLEVNLIDHYTGGRFNEVLRQGLAEGEYKRKYEVLLFPSKELTRRLDALFDDPSPWEAMLRYPVYIEGLNYANCNNQVERTYSTYALLLLDGRNLPPPGYEWGSRPNHQGIDLGFRVGEQVPSPIQGRVAWLVHDAGLPDTWSGIVIEGSGADSTRTVRIIGLAPEVTAGDPITVGQPVGIVQNPRMNWKGLAPHLHVEYYELGQRKDAAWVIAERWTDRTFAKSLADEYLWKTQDFERLITQGAKAERARSYREAIEKYSQVYGLRIWDVSNRMLLHYQARCWACLEEYAEAARIQQQLVDLMEKELAYAEGEVPHPDLGTLGAVTPEAMLRILLDHQRRNLNCYELKMDTVFVY